jgi:hypothetical protein
LKLVLDEHFSRRIAAELRRRGHDVIAVSEREDLRGLPDEGLMAHARGERRAMATQDFADFASLVREAMVAETEHFGVLFVPKRVWSSLRDFEPLVVALERFLDEGPRDEALLGGVAWLEGQG